MHRLKLWAFIASLWILAHVAGGKEAKVTMVKRLVLPNVEYIPVSPSFSLSSSPSSLSSSPSSPSSSLLSLERVESSEGDKAGANIPLTSFAETSAEIRQKTTIGRDSPSNPYEQATVFSEVSDEGSPTSDGRTYTRINGGAEAMSYDDINCVLCQYFVQRMKNDVIRYSSNVSPYTYPSYMYPPSSPLTPRALPFGSPTSLYYNIWLQTEESITPRTGTSISSSIARPIIHPSQPQQPQQPQQHHEINPSFVESQTTVRSFRPGNSNSRHRSFKSEMTNSRFLPVGPHVGPHVSPHAGTVLLEQNSQRQNKQRENGRSLNSVIPGWPKYPNTDGALTPRRYRAHDMLSYRPPMERVDFLNPPNPNPLREQIRFLQSQVFTAVYQAFEGTCASRVPEAFSPTCSYMLHDFRFVAEGLHFGDRPDEMCMRLNFCSASSYIRSMTPHTTFTPTK